MSPNHTLVKLPSSYDALSVSSFSQSIGSGLKLVRALHEAGVHDTPTGVDFTLRTVIADRFAANQLSVLSSFDVMLLNDELK